jgi:hypothetical protein
VKILVVDMVVAIEEKGDDLLQTLAEIITVPSLEL